MKLLRELLKESDDEYNIRDSGVIGYRGIHEDDLKKILSKKPYHPLPSTDLMPLDFEVVEYSIGEDIRDMEDEEIEEWVQDIVPWYDGSLRSIKGGVNFTTEEDNAEGYGKYVVVLGIAPGSSDSDIAYFSDSHAFARNYKNLVVLAYRKSNGSEWIKVQ